MFSIATDFVIPTPTLQTPVHQEVLVFISLDYLPLCCFPAYWILVGTRDPNITTHFSGRVFDLQIVAQKCRVSQTTKIMQTFCGKNVFKVRLFSFFGQNLGSFWGVFKQLHINVPPGFQFSREQPRFHAFHHRNSKDKVSEPQI